MVHSLKTPRFLKAVSPKGLEKAMLLNNIKRKSWHDYQIVFDGKAWFAWYYVDLSGSVNKDMDELTNNAAI